jgi:S-adenosylmethionine:tRNA-ribosyltransferase-isomerase (queuine synthetase)
MRSVTKQFMLEEGAVAAPTAGLHFSKHLLKKLEIKGIKFAEVTLTRWFGDIQSC